MIFYKKTFKKSSSHKRYRSGDSPTEEGSLRINDYYQPLPKRHKREVRQKEARVDLPHFHGKENIEVYLDLEMKVEQLFACN